MKAFEELIKAYPQSPAVPEAVFRLGYAYYLGGDYDKSVENFQKVPTTKGAPAEIVELAMSLTPQVLAAKAAKLDPKDPLRDKSLNDAITQFDAFLAKIPTERRGGVGQLRQGARLFPARRSTRKRRKPLRLNLQKFPQSEIDSGQPVHARAGARHGGVTALQKTTGRSRSGEWPSSTKARSCSATSSPNASTWRW